VRQVRQQRRQRTSMSTFSRLYTNSGGGRSIQAKMTLFAPLVHQMPNTATSIQYRNPTAAEFTLRMRTHVFHMHIRREQAGSGIECPSFGMCVGTVHCCIVHNVLRWCNVLPHTFLLNHQRLVDAVCSVKLLTDTQPTRPLDMALAHSPTPLSNELNTPRTNIPGLLWQCY
jgi:hypothetical protein